MGALQVRCLAQAGHRRLGMVAVDDDRVAMFRDSRQEGVREAAATMGLARPLELVLDTGEAAAAMDIPLPLQFRRAGSRDVAVRRVAETLRAWSDEPDPVTAICCFNDLFAGLVIAAARSIGLDVPGDLSVIGVDDEPLGGVLQPAITTVRFNFESTSAYAGAWLRAALGGKSARRPPGSETIELIERESVAPLRP